MADLSTCNSPTCAYTAEGVLTVCPKCGGSMRAIRESRARGWALVVLGLIMVGMMAVILVNMSPSLMHPGVQGADGGRFTGTADQARLILYLFWALAAFGALMTLNGIHQIRTGYNSKLFAGLGFAVLAGVILLVAVTLQQIK
ncbi:MAG TPA: hypothetical protein VGX37_07960 [Allosphingosinicella sp.]|nr:hypothetical protein [Allosphingosinicella sp.]